MRHVKRGLYGIYARFNNQMAKESSCRTEPITRDYALPAPLLHRYDCPRKEPPTVSNYQPLANGLAIFYAEQETVCGRVSLGSR